MVSTLSATLLSVAQGVGTLLAAGLFHRCSEARWGLWGAAGLSVRGWLWSWNGGVAQAAGTHKGRRYRTGGGVRERVAALTVGLESWRLHCADA